MLDAEVDFVERLGLISEEDGFPRIAGRIFGYLLLREGPFSLDHLTQELGVSKASVSTNVRFLEQIGLLVRTSLPGDRRDFYRMAPDAPTRSFARVRGKMLRLRSLFDETLDRLPATSPAERAPLHEMRDWYAFLLDETEGLEERWQASAPGRSRGSSTEGAGG